MGARPPAESSDPVRVLRRGMDVRVALNRLECAPIHALAAAVGLPRTTTFRILETLRLSGFLERDAADCYRPALRVRCLSDGFDDAALLAQISRPLLEKFGEVVNWPLAIATPAGAAMMIRQTTPGQGPLPLELHGLGLRLPLLSSAAGRAYLASCPAVQRDTLLELLSRSSLPEGRLARSRVDVERLLDDTRSQGFGIAHRARRMFEETSLAVAVSGRHRILGAVSLRFVTGAMPLRAAIEQFIPRLREVARDLDAQMSCPVES